MEETVDESPDVTTLESPFAGITLRLALAGITEEGVIIFTAVVLLNWLL